MTSVSAPTVARRIWYFLPVLGLLAAMAFVYWIADPERLTLDDRVRREASGQFVRLGDGFTHYELGGAPGGHVVVLAAGYSVPYYVWDPTFQALTAAGYRVLRYDYYGRGLSDRLDVPFTDEFYVRQLAELLDSQKISGAIDLAGLSFGGSVATSFADKYPARVRSLIYVGPSFRTPEPLPPMTAMPRVWSFLTAVFDERAWADEQLGDFLHPERFSDWPARFREQLQYKGFRRARLSEMVANAGADQTDELERVGEHPRPVLVIWGKQDVTVPFEQNEALLAMMQRARLVAVDQSGHLPQWEQPDVTHAAMIDFLHELDRSQ